MCFSPSDMTAEELQRRIDQIQKLLESDNPSLAYPAFRNMYEGRLEKYEDLLKEKAESGQMV